MTVLLVVLTVCVFVTMDYFFRRKRAPAAVGQGVSSQIPLPRSKPNLVAGFEVPDNLRFHPGHSWALSESPNLVRTGWDQFAASLTGAVEKIVLPRRGQWIRQGQKAWEFYHHGHKVELVSPIEGTVADINDSVVRNPELARSDPYGEGWLMMVQAPDAATNFRNLLSGVLARKWMEEAAARLRSRVHVLAAGAAQDGGEALKDISAVLAEHEWLELSREFFLN